MATAAQYEDMKVDELRREARQRGVSGTSKMRKSELLEVLGSGDDGGGDGGRDDAGNGGARGRELTSTAERESHPGKTLVTTNHDVIRAWAEARGARPATVPGTEHGDRLGVLTFDFPGYGGENLREVSWDEWFRTFDERGLRFIFQEHKKDGSQSNFFRLENPNREDA
jgi:hypothetical protein